MKAMQNENKFIDNQVGRNPYDSDFNPRGNEEEGQNFKHLSESWLNTSGIRADDAYQVDLHKEGSLI